MMTARQIVQRIEEASPRWFVDPAFVAELKDAVEFSRSLLDDMKGVYMTAVNSGDWMAVEALVKNGIWCVSEDGLWIVPFYGTHEEVEGYGEQENGYLKVYEFLIANGADQTLANKNGETLLDYWSGRGFPRTTRFFSDQMLREVRKRKTEGSQ